MKVYVDLTYTVAVEVDHDEYETSTETALVEACRNDPDFAYRIGNGPHPVFEVDWSIPDLMAHMRKHFDEMPATGCGFQVGVTHE